MFSGEEAVARHRLNSHQTFVEKMAKREGKETGFFLTAAESEGLRMAFERKLAEFCVKFVPPMPKVVTGTAMQYFKRFYINNSVMDYHPKEIL